MTGRLRQLRLLGRCLADSYPYCFRLGEWLRIARPDWLAEFELAEPAAARSPMRQAADFSLLEWCERNHQEELDRILVSDFFPLAPAYLRQELLNTVSWYAARVGC